MTDLYEDLAKKLNVPVDTVKAALLEEEKAGKMIITDQGNPIADAKVGLSRISDYLDDKLPFSEVAQSLSAVHDGIAAKEGITELPKDQVPARPTVDGLPEAMGAVLGSCTDFPAEMYNAQIDQPRLSALRDRVVSRRALLDEIGWFSGMITDDLAVYERAGADLITLGYSKVRATAKSERKFGDSLKDMEDWQYGSAKQAVGTRAHSTHVKKQVAAQVPQSIFVKGQEQGRSDALQQLAALLADPPGGATLPVGTPAATAAPAGATTAHPHTAHPHTAHPQGRGAKR